jgi:hypothetical protein
MEQKRFKYQKQIDELIAVSIGNSLAEGVLTNDDGKNTAPSNNGHFDFYEYEGCDLSKSFQITKQLI